MKKRLEETENSFEALISHHLKMVEDNKRIFLELAETRKEFDQKIEMLVVMIFGFLKQNPTSNYNPPTQNPPESKRQRGETTKVNNTNLLIPQKNNYSLDKINNNQSDSKANMFQEGSGLNQILNLLNTKNGGRNHLFANYNPNWSQLQRMFEKMRKDSRIPTNNLNLQSTLHNMANQKKSLMDQEKTAEPPFMQLENQRDMQAPLKIEVESLKSQSLNESYSFPFSPTLRKRGENRKTSMDSFSLATGGVGNKKLKIADVLNQSMDLDTSRNEDRQFKLNTSGTDFNTGGSSFIRPSDAKMANMSLLQNIIDAPIPQKGPHDFDSFLNINANRMDSIGSFDDVSRSSIKM